MLFTVGRIRCFRHVTGLLYLFSTTGKPWQPGAKHESLPDVTSRRSFTQLFAHFARIFTYITEHDTVEPELFAHESHILADKSELLTNVPELFADESKLFTYIAELFTHFTQLLAYFSELFAHFTKLLANVAELFAY